MAGRKRKKRGLGYAGQWTQQAGRSDHIEPIQYVPHGITASPSQAIVDFKTAVIYGGLALAIVGGLVLVARKYLKKGQKSNAMRTSLYEGDPSKFAMELHQAIYGLGTDEEKIFEVFNKIPSLAVYEQVMARYRDMYSDADVNEDLEDDLSREDLDRVKAILSLKPDGRDKVWKLFK